MAFHITVGSHIMKMWKLHSGCGQFTIILHMEATGFSYSYSVQDVQVLDHSDFSTEEASWEHVIDSSKNVGKNTYYCKPGLQVKIPNGWIFATTGYDKVQYAFWTYFGWYYWAASQIDWTYSELSNPP